MGTMGVRMFAALGQSADVLDENIAEHAPPQELWRLVLSAMFLSAYYPADLWGCQRSACTFTNSQFDKDEILQLLCRDPLPVLL